jgi:uncharacterized membrane protein
MMSLATLKTLHVLFACLFVGNVVVSGIWAALAERTGKHEIIKFSNRLVLLTDFVLTAPCALGVFITGHLMASQYGGSTGPYWLSWSYALFGLSGLIWAVVLLPIQLKQRAILREHNQITADYRRLSKVWQFSGAVATLFPFPILYLMVSKAA